jgi:hypothetical protein
MGSPDPRESGETQMHPFALYLVAVDSQREQRGSDRDRRRVVAAVDALPLPDAAPRSRMERLSALLRRQVARATGA